jgi:hypothetical protein
MTLISHRHKFIFIKTKKTAGTSVEEMIEAAMLGIPEGGFGEYSEERVTAEGYVSHRSQKFNKPNSQLLPTHATSRKVVKALGKSRFENYTKAVSVRNPFDQIVSFFWWRLESYPKAQRMVAKFPMPLMRLGFTLWFILSQRRIRSLSYTDQLALEGALPDFRVIRFESLESDLRNLLGDLEIPCQGLSLSNRKATQRLRSEPYQRYYSRFLKKAVTRSRASDLAFFNYSWVEPKEIA